MDNACYCGGRYLHCNTKKREIRIMHVAVEGDTYIAILRKGRYSKAAEKSMKQTANVSAPNKMEVV